MNARYVVKPKADRDLDDYADYLAKEASLAVALRFFDAAYRTFAILATQPKMGLRSRIKYTGIEAIRIFRVTGFADRLILRAFLRREGLAGLYKLSAGFGVTLCFGTLCGSCRV